MILVFHIMNEGTELLDYTYAKTINPIYIGVHDMCREDRRAAIVLRIPSLNWCVDRLDVYPRMCWALSVQILSTICLLASRWLGCSGGWNGRIASKFTSSFIVVMDDSRLQFAKNSSRMLLRWTASLRSQTEPCTPLLHSTFSMLAAQSESAYPTRSWPLRLESNQWFWVVSS